MPLNRKSDSRPISSISRRQPRFDVPCYALNEVERTVRVVPPGFRQRPASSAGPRPRPRIRNAGGAERQGRRDPRRGPAACRDAGAGRLVPGADHSILDSTDPLPYSALIEWAAGCRRGTPPPRCGLRRSSRSRRPGSARACTWTSRSRTPPTTARRWAGPDVQRRRGSAGREVLAGARE